MKYARPSTCIYQTLIPQDKIWQDPTSIHHSKRLKPLVGGFNPFDKYWSNWIISPRIRGENKKNLKPPPRPVSPSGLYTKHSLPDYKSNHFCQSLATVRVQHLSWGVLTIVEPRHGLKVWKAQDWKKLGFFPSPVANQHLSTPKIPKENIWGFP